MLSVLFHWILAIVTPPHCSIEIRPVSSYSQPYSHALNAYSHDKQTSANLPASSLSQITSVPFLEVTGKFSCSYCRKGYPFQGLKVGSCLTLRNELSEKTHLLTKQKTLLERDTRTESSGLREPRRTALSHGLQSQVLWEWG